MKSHLLPEGFRDSLPDLAAKEFDIISKFIDFMSSNGYEIIRPPLLEFENSLFFLSKNKRNDNSFRVLDPLSQKMMGVRSDMTSQVARIACGALKKKERPLRLGYSGEILKVQNNQLNISRQFNQIGGEIVGIGNNFCEIEIISLIRLFLNILKIKNYSLSLSMPSLFESVCNDFKLDKNQRSFLREKYENKNFLEINKISPDIADVSKVLLECIGKFDVHIEKLKVFKFPRLTQIEINKFLNSLNALKKNIPEITINIDPIEIDKFGYHNGIMYKFYSKNFDELFNGGRYNVYDENCIGFSGTIENLIKECSIEKKIKKKIFIPLSELNFNRIELIKNGFVLINETFDKNTKKIDHEKNAKKNNCQYFLVNSKVLKVN